MNFDYFWCTKPYIDDYTCGKFVGFHMFDATHIYGLVLFAIISIVLGIFYHKMSQKARRNTLIVLAALCLADELFKHIGCLAVNQYSWGYLPLHLCSINIFVILAYVLKPTDLKAEILYALSIPGASLALISPSWTKLPMLNFMHLHSYTIHVLLVLFPILLLAGGFRPSYKRLPKVFLCLLVAAACIFPLNKLLGTNFMFLNGSDNNLILVFFENIFGDPGYLIGLPVLLVIIWTLMYLPWIISDRRRAKCSQTTPKNPD